MLRKVLVSHIASWEIFLESVEDSIVSYLFSCIEPVLNAKNNSASTFSNPMNELENLKPGFQHANVRAFNLCTFGGKKSGIEFDFTCVSEVDSFHPNAHAP